jgi:phosphatidylserine decarboxylase
MKKNYFIYLCLLFITITYTSCNIINSDNKANYGDKTLELIDIVENNPNIKSLLISSINKAKEINPNKNSNPAQTLEEYYEFITLAEKSMPWSFLSNTKYSELYNKIDQSLCYFYFVNDQPIPKLEGKGYYNNSLQYVEPYSSWLTSFNMSWGSFLDTEASWNENYYQMALADDKFGLNNDWYEDPSNWKTFNQFFSRQLKSPDKRPITAPNDNSIVISPADSEPQGVWEIDSNSNIIQKQGVVIKSGTLNSIEKLIGEDSEYEHVFSNGTFTHSFLDVNDYHRYHFPLSGVIKEVRVIPGQNASGCLITWDSVNNRYIFDASIPGWQSVEVRGCVILETEEFGVVALLPIGMSQVCSVNFEDNIKVGAQVTKGDMLGCFYFGGSDYMMIFQKKAGFILDATKENGKSQSYKHLLLGEQIGHLTGNK